PRSAPDSTLFPYTTLFRSEMTPRAMCVMVTQRPRHTLAERAIKAFHRQFYYNRTLLIMSDHPEDLSHYADNEVIIFQAPAGLLRSEEHTSELQSLTNLVCR